MNAAKKRLAEVVNAFRELNDGTLADWRFKYPDLYEHIMGKPISTELTDHPIERLVENLRTELDLRMAELLLTQTL